MSDRSSRGGMRRWFINPSTWLIALPVFLVGLIATTVTAQPIIEGSALDPALIPSVALLLGGAWILRYATLTVGPRSIVVRTLWGRRLVSLGRLRDVRVVEYSHWLDTRNMISLVLDAGETVLVKGLTGSADLPALGFARRARAIAAAAGIESSERLARLDPMTGRLVYLDSSSPDPPDEGRAAQDLQTFGKQKARPHHRAMLAVSSGILGFVIARTFAGPVPSVLAGTALGLAALWHLLRR